jgi:hypothetical protein
MEGYRVALIAVVMGVVTSAGACTTGLGCVAGAVTGTISADFGAAGLNQAITGNTQITNGERVLQSLGLSPQTAAITYGLIGLSPAAVEAVAMNRAINEAAAYNALVKQSYTPIEQFTAKGLQANPQIMNTPQAQALVNEYLAAGISAARANELAEGVIETGKSLPQVFLANSNTELIKIVPKNAAGGDAVTPYSPFFMTRQEYTQLSKLSSFEIAQQLGLPVEQAVRGSQLGFDVYSMTPISGVTPKVFTSNVAPIQQGEYLATGGAQQVIVPNRQLWTTPAKISEIKGGK